MKHLLRPMTDVDILQLSSGEIKNSKLLDSKQLPKVGGLFCQRVFGPIKDFKCRCGKYNGWKYKGTTCENCGVLVESSSIRRERFGHIVLPIPVFNPMFKNTLAQVLGLGSNHINDILTGNVYFKLMDGKHFYLNGVKDPKCIAIATSLEEYDTWSKSIPALYDIVKRINLKKSYELISGRRQALLGQLLSRKLHPKIFFLRNIPVMPPTIRPISDTKGRLLSDAKNDLYASVIKRKTRLDKLIEVLDEIPKIILELESISLQKSINNLFLGGAVDLGGLPLPSIVENLKTKTGLPRWNLLGKRVDFSGRSVITSGPNLELNEIALPEQMVYELLKPFILKGLLDRGYANGMRSALRQYNQKYKSAVEVMMDIYPNHQVYLNRQPSLHRYSVLAFNITLSPYKAILLPPMLCSPFNADYDGDTMAVHLPLGYEAKKEVNDKLLVTNNLISVADGTALLKPSHEMMIGLYLMTKLKESDNYIIENSIKRLETMHQNNYLPINATITFRKNGQSFTTCLGRLLIGQLLGVHINDYLTKQTIGQLVTKACIKYDANIMIKKLKQLQDYGFHYATIEGFSICIDDFIIPSSKEESFKIANAIEFYNKQTVNDDNKLDKHGTIISNWDNTITNLQNDFITEAGDDNPLVIMNRTGARASMGQISQLVVAKGMVTAIDNSIIEHPIENSLREGLTVQEYFISCSGSRKSLADKQFVTPISGYLARKLINCTRDLYITDNDCGTQEGIKVTAKLSKNRYGLDGELINIDNFLENENVMIRSPITCKAKKGICQKCYGLNEYGKTVNINFSAGVVAGQSLSEPATQLSMRTFHFGGAATVRKINPLEVKTCLKGVVKLETDEFGTKIILEDGFYYIHTNATLKISSGQKIDNGDCIAVYPTDSISNADISGKLPLLESYFELSKIKGNESIIATKDGQVTFKVRDTKVSLFIDKELQGFATGIPILVHDGQTVEKGQPLTIGDCNLKRLYLNTNDLPLVGSIFVNTVNKLYSEEGINVFPVHLEMIFRGMSELVKLDNGLLGLRRIDGGEPLIMGVSEVGKNFPSWLKGISFGWTSSILENHAVKPFKAYDIPSEELMMGKLIAK